MNTFQCSLIPSTKFNITFLLKGANIKFVDGYGLNIDLFLANSELNRIITFVRFESNLTNVIIFSHDYTADIKSIIKVSSPKEDMLLITVYYTYYIYDVELLVCLNIEDKDKFINLLIDKRDSLSSLFNNE